MTATAEAFRSLLTALCLLVFVIAVGATVHLLVEAVRLGWGLVAP